MNIQEAMQGYQARKQFLAERGINLEGVMSFLPDGFAHNAEAAQMALDAQPQLVTDPNSAIPALLTTFIDPTIIKVLFAPNNATKILPENKKGDWLMDTTMFPVTEETGEVSSYGDYSNNGSAGVNMNWPQRQNYLYQTIEQYGQRELERAGLGKINYVNEIDMAATSFMARYQNLTYFFGVQGLQNYGMVNDPNLSAAIAPALKAYGGNKWVVNGVVVATANEIYNDIQSLYGVLVSQSAGLINQESELVLGISPNSAVALTATNTFNVNVSDLLKKNFPNLRIEQAIQYGQTSSTNQYGIAAGNMAQMWAPTVEGQQTAFCAFSEKMRAFPIVKEMSAFKKKVMGGTWGTVIRQAFAVAQMVGI